MLIRRRGRYCDPATHESLENLAGDYTVSFFSISFRGVFTWQRKQRITSAVNRDLYLDWLCEWLITKNVGEKNPCLAVWQVKPFGPYPAQSMPVGGHNDVGIQWLVLDL